jgi:cobalt/nickel transport system permease protein
LHIPDGFISPKMYLPLYGISVGLWAWGLRRMRRTLDEKTIPWLAVLAALSFVLMMVAVPFPGGTSVHASGICLLAVIFGVWAAFLSVSLVLLIQALLFGTGGITSLPLNALALGLAGGAVASWTFRWLRRWNETGALAVAAWFSVMVPALLVALALGLQPQIAAAADGTPLFFPFGFSVTLPAVLVPHAALGVGEGVLTVLVYRLVGRIKGRAGP